MATALITGGTGFIGAHVARALTEAGYTVRILRRPNSKLNLLEGVPVQHAIGDVMDADSLRVAMEGCDWVFHVAAIADYWRAQRVKMYLVNVDGTRHVLEAAREAGVRRVVFTSSAAAIGLRPDGKPSDESEPFNLPPARFPYGHSKWLAEGLVQKAVAAGQDVVILNPSVVFGPGDANLISGSMITEAARGIIPPFYPAGSVSAIDVRDVARAHLAAAERGRTGERYVLGTMDMSYAELFRHICGLVGAKAPSRPLPRPLADLAARGIGVVGALGLKLPVNADQVWLSARPVCFDSRKAWRELGTPRISLTQSLADTYQWYKENGYFSRG